jgi:hypothetical protein
MFKAGVKMTCVVVINPCNEISLGVTHPCRDGATLQEATLQEATLQEATLQEAAFERRFKILPICLMMTGLLMLPGLVMMIFWVRAHEKNQL